MRDWLTIAGAECWLGMSECRDACLLDSVATSDSLFPKLFEYFPVPYPAIVQACLRFEQKRATKGKTKGEDTGKIAKTDEGCNDRVVRK